MDAMDTAVARRVVKLEIASIFPNPAQPRRQFAEGALNSLAESIRMHGLISPIIVRRVNIGKYELIAGERRLRALKILGRSHAEAIIVTAYDSQSAVLALIENLQREQLHYLEEAAACRAILDSEGITQDELARRIGRSPSALANRLRLMKLSAPVRELLMNSALTERHARALLSVSDPDAQYSMAVQADKLQLTVRQLEGRIARMGRKSPVLPRCIARDHRLYVNAVIDTVDKLRSMGADSEISLTESDTCTEIHILLKKKV